MALTDENGGGIPATMLVGPANVGGGYPVPMYGGNGGNNGFGDGGWWIILLFVLLGGWGGGMGGMNGNLYPWLNNSQNINGGFRDQMLNSSIDAIGAKIDGVNASVNSGVNAITAQLYNGTIADMQRSFDLQSQMANCCCENRAATADLKYTLATEACATRSTDTANTTALLNALNAGVQSIKDQMCNDKIESKNDTIAQLRSELLYARGQASQDVQTGVIQAGQRALANEIEQYVLPTPRPAYIVQNPNCCTNSCGLGM